MSSPAFFEQLDTLLTALQAPEPTGIASAIASLRELDPNSPWIIECEGLWAMRRGETEQALECFEKALELAPEIAAFHLNYANTLKRVGETIRAKSHLETALGIKPDYVEAEVNLAGLYYSQGAFSEAIRHYKRALARTAHYVSAHYGLALCYVQTDQWQSAISHLEAVLKLAPQHQSAAHNLAIAYVHVRNFKEALPRLAVILETNQSDPHLWYHYGIVMSGTHQHQEAITAYQKALALMPEYGEAHHNLAISLMTLKDNYAAKKHFESAVRLMPNNMTAKHMLSAFNGETMPGGAPKAYVEALFNQYAYTYDSHVVQSLEYRVPEQLRQLVVPFLDQLPRPCVAVDLGCGTGLMAPFLQDLITKLYGVDVAENMLAVANQKGGYHKLYRDDMIEFLNGKTPFWDLVVMADVLGYSGDIQPLFEAIDKKLNQGGWVLFSTEALSEETKADYQLLMTGRYAHAPQYVDSVCQSLNWESLVVTTTTLRKHDTSVISGNLWLFKKP